MSIKRTCMNLSAFLAVGGLIMAPLTAFADHGDKGQGKGHGKGQWNPAPPKKNGRHDNRDWNKDEEKRFKAWSKYDEKRYKIERKYDMARYKADRKYREEIDKLNRQYG